AEIDSDGTTRRTRVWQKYDLQPSKIGPNQPCASERYLASLRRRLQSSSNRSHAQSQDSVHRASACQSISSPLSSLTMSDVTRILSAIEQGDLHAAEQLLPLVYDELRRLAAQKLAQEKPGQTLDATALVHEAYVRLVGTEGAPRWRSRGHFFAT